MRWKGKRHCDVALSAGQLFSHCALHCVAGWRNRATRCNNIVQCSEDSSTFLRVVSQISVTLQGDTTPATSSAACLVEQEGGEKLTYGWQMLNKLDETEVQMFGSPTQTKPRERASPQASWSARVAFNIAITWWLHFSEFLFDQFFLFQDQGRLLVLKQRKIGLMAPNSELP